MLCVMSARFAAGSVGAGTLGGTFVAAGKKYSISAPPRSVLSFPGGSARWLATNGARVERGGRGGAGSGSGGRTRRKAMPRSSFSRLSRKRGFAEQLPCPAIRSPSETEVVIDETAGTTGGGAGDSSSQTSSVNFAADANDDGASADNNTAMVAGAVPLLFAATLLGAGAYYKDDITSFLLWFTDYVDGLGPSGPAIFMSLYVALEVLAVPAIPLTMSAGAIFGSVQGTAMVSVSGTAAAALSFLIARYALRDRIKEVAAQNPKFAAIDNAIGEDSFRVVALLRLSPLLPFALSNYLYGLTSVKFRPYVLASWLGMLPGTFAYVSAGSVGMTLMEAGADGSVGGGGDEMTHIAQVACGFGFAVLSGAYVTRIATEALKDVEEEMNSIDESSSSGTD